jgi:hypothetical protein
MIENIIVGVIEAGHSRINVVFWSELPLSIRAPLLAAAQRLVNGERPAKLRLDLVDVTTT